MERNIRKSRIIISFLAVMTAILLFLCLAGCSKNSQQNNANADPIVGQWETKWKSTQQADSQEKQVIFSINEDGNAYWMTLADSQMIQISNIIDQTWEKVGDNTYSFTNTYNENNKFEYNKDDDTLVSLSYGRTYTRLDQIVGIWTGVASEEVGSGNSSTILKPDGTGIATASFENGTADVVNLTWNKTTKNNYEVNFSSGIKHTYTVSEDGKSLTTDDGRSKTKCFTDSTFLVAVSGAWVCPEKNYIAVLNSDGTGFRNLNGQEIHNFTWKNTINGVDVTYTNGYDKNGNSHAGKTYSWTYNKDDNSLTTSAGTKYIRPTSSVPGLITFK